MGEVREGETFALGVDVGPSRLYKSGSYTAKVRCLVACRPFPDDLHIGRMFPMGGKCRSVGGRFLLLLGVLIFPLRRKIEGIS